MKAMQLRVLRDAKTGYGYAVRWKRLIGHGKVCTWFKTLDAAKAEASFLVRLGTAEVEIKPVRILREKHP